MLHENMISLKIAHATLPINDHGMHSKEESKHEICYDIYNKLHPMQQQLKASSISLATDLYHKQFVC